MLTPIFEIEQNENNLIIKIRAPYAKIATTEIEYAEELFVFSSKPYFLRIHLPRHVLDDETGWAKYDSDSGTFTVCVPKLNKGEHFPGLDMITELLRPQREKPTAQPLVDELPEEGTSLEQDDQEADSDDDYYMEQNPRDIKEKQTSGLETGYGFAWRKSGILEGLYTEIGKLIELENPEESTIDERALECYQTDARNFNQDHYLADTFQMDDQLEHILHLEYKCKNKLTKSDIRLLKDLPKRKLPKLTPDEERSIMYSIVDLGYAFCYDGRTTEWENSVESGWTIEKLSPSLSWLVRFHSCREALVTCFARALSKPLYRNWQLCQLVLDDLKVLFNAGRTAIVHMLCRIYRMMVDGGEFRYLYNDLLITDLLIWIQSVDDDMVKSIADELQKVKIEKIELTEFNLESLEVDGQMQMMQIDSNQNIAMDSDDLPE